MPLQWRFSDQCLCGLMHVKTGTTVIGVVFLVIGALNSVAVIGALMAHNALAIDGLLNSIITILLGTLAIQGVKRSQPTMLLCVLIGLGIGLAMLGIFLVFAPILLIAPDVFFGEMDHFGISALRITVLIFGSIFLVAAILNIWFMNTIYNCYIYLKKQGPPQDVQYQRY
ncbi:hypothetical protein QR680_018943 [Steinernema hermaphroditum]|uniref:Uncharacterized protein n=1 Tax=Steinernema hermaphroditum TaxID=289476 RepID=A0AA39HKU2_9BILA|nr:hypothetical protein QR680_018943 [Steinernema hermaphroditum]